MISWNSVFFFLKKFLFIYLFFFFIKSGRIPVLFLTYLNLVNKSKSIKLSILYFYKKLKNFFFLDLVFFKDFFAFFLNVVSYFLNKLIFWKPIFRKISYFGLYQASRIKWLSKNLNNKV